MKIIIKILKMMFYRKGRLFMPYIYAFVFLSIIATYMIVRLISPLGNVDKIKISDHIIEVLFLEVIAFIKISTWGKKDIMTYDGEERRKD